MNNMFYPSVILFAVTASVLAGDDECLKIFEGGFIKQCCKGKLPQPSPEFEAIYRECHSLPSGPNSCEREMCIASKKGFLTPDGSKLDISKIKEKMEKEFKIVPELSKAIAEECTDEAISKFGPPDVCDPIKMERCIQLQFAKTCPDWASDGPCEGVKDLNAMCKKKYA